MLHPGKQTQAISLSGRHLYQLNHFTAQSLVFLKNAQNHHFEYKILKNFDVCVTKRYFVYVILCGVN